MLYLGVTTKMRTIWFATIASVGKETPGSNQQNEDTPHDHRKKGRFSQQEEAEVVSKKKNA